MGVDVPTAVAATLLLGLLMPEVPAQKAMQKLHQVCIRFASGLLEGQVRCTTPYSFNGLLRLTWVNEGCMLLHDLKRSGRGMINGMMAQAVMLEHVPGHQITLFDHTHNKPDGLSFTCRVSL